VFPGADIGTQTPT